MNKKKLYDWLGVFKTTKERFLHTMRGSDTQDSFLNKLLDLYDKMIGTKILNKIENKTKIKKKPKRKLKK